MSKIAIILHAEPGTHDALGRAVHALLYTQELHENKCDVKLVFDGGGTKWVPEISKPDHPAAPLFSAVKGTGAILGVCGFCMGAFEADRGAIEKSGIPVVAEYQGHPSIARLVLDGYQVITL